MKSISLLLNLVLLLLVFYLGCKDKFFGKEDKPKSSTYCTDCDTYNPTEKYGMISYNTAKMLAENYYKSEGKRYIFNESGRTNEEDARNIWFDLRILKNFIAFIESQACKFNCDTAKHLGVRIYYGKYPADSKLGDFADLQDVPKKFANHHTLFMMPTYWDTAAKKHVDFDPLNLSQDCKFQTFPRDLTPESLAAYSASSVSNLSATSKNYNRNTQISKDQKQVVIKPQEPKTFYILGGQTYQTMSYAVPVTGDQQNHGDLAPPPGAAEIYPTTPMPTIEE